MFNLPLLLPALTASVILGILGVGGFLLSSSTNTPNAMVRIEPEKGTMLVDQTFTVHIIIETSVPTNVFKGALTFDKERLAVKAIQYNTSIADLWAEEPWYSNGDGTINFIGGTTKAGGFIGAGSLISVEFIAKTTGDAAIAMSEMKILQHDGLGTEISITTPIDALFAVNATPLEAETIFETKVNSTKIQVLQTTPTTDLNQDGKQSITDVSIFMADIVTQNLRSDFNQDGSVTLKDLSILTK